MKIFFLIGINEEKSENRNEAIFREKIGMNGSLISGMENNMQRSAKSWPKPDR